MVAALWLLPVLAISIYLIYLGGVEGVRLVEALQGPSSPSSTIAIIVISLFAFPAIWATLWLLHGRNIPSLFGPTKRIDWTAFRTAAVITAVLAGVGFALSWMNGAALPNIAARQWAILLPIALPLLFLQIASEELLFRGYIVQQLGSRFQSKWVWWVLPAFLFGLLHWDSTTFQTNAPLVAIAATLLGLVAGDLTARTGNLGAALGLHFANNFFALLVMGLPGPASGLALFVADVDLNDTAQVRAGLLGQIVTITVVYIIYLLIVARRRAGQLHSLPTDLN